MRPNALRQNMKRNHPQEWFEQHIEKEGNVEIGAGIPPAFWSVVTGAEPLANAVQTGAEPHHASAQTDLASIRFKPV
jgi:hypothetical protein